MYKFKLIQASKSLTSKDIKKVEELIGCALPPSLKDFYINYNGGKISGNRNVFVDIEKDIEKEVNSFLPIKYKRFEGDSTLEESYDLFVNKKKLIPNGFIPFAMDSGGFRFCMDCESESIFFNNLDHIENPEGPMEFVSTSIVDFIAGMKTEKEAYGE